MAHNVNTASSRPGSREASPQVGKIQKIKNLFGKLRSYQDIDEATANNRQLTAADLLMDTRNPTFVKNYQNNLAVSGPQHRDLTRSISNSPQVLPKPAIGGNNMGGGTPQMHSLRNTTGNFNVNPAQLSLAQQQAGLRGSLQTGQQGMNNNPQNAANNNFNIFEHFQNQAMNQQGAHHISPFGGANFNVPQAADPHQSLYMQSFHQYAGMNNANPNAGQFCGSQAPVNPQFIDPYVMNQQMMAQQRNNPNMMAQQGNVDDFLNDKSNEHTKVKEDTSESNSLNVSKGPSPDAFHGKSMRSIQLFNSPTSASPKLLHPSLNPMVKADSPKTKPRSNLPARNQPSMLDIHADSCYNFLNKRRFRIADNDLTPLEGFFLKESINQFKVANALQRRPANLFPNNKPPQPRRSKRYLLVLDIDETLVHSEPIMTNSQPTPHANQQFDKTLRFDNPNGTCDVYGIRFRPYLHEFIRRMSQVYDLAVYTASARDYADGVMDTLDPNRTIFCTRLYRENCYPVSGMNIKNMVNFDGQDAFIVDNLIYSYAYHMGQGIPICAFVDDPMDVELQDLAEILENLPYYDSLPALLQDLLGLDEFYQDLSHRLMGQPRFG